MAGFSRDNPTKPVTDRRSTLSRVRAECELFGLVSIPLTYIPLTARPAVLPLVIAQAAAARSAAEPLGRAQAADTPSRSSNNRFQAKPPEKPPIFPFAASTR